MLRFGPFTLEEQSGELRRDGEIVPLAPQPFRLLLALASRPGELVTREELRQQVWGDGTFVDFERGLNFCVLQARTALGDDAKQPAYIETLPRRGYRFVATIQEPLPEPAPAIIVPPSPASAPRGRRLRRFSILTAAAALLVFGVVAALQREEPVLPAASSPAAHDAYVRGRNLWIKGDVSSVQASLGELREAVRLEPSFVLAHIALAESLHSLARRGRISPIAATGEIRHSSEAALRLAPMLAQSHGITAMLRFWYEWDWDGAEESYRAAIRLNPNEPGTLHDHGWLLISRGAFEEGMAQIRRAQELDPVSPRANMHVAWAYTYTGQYAAAVREARRALELSPGYHEAFHCLEHAYLLSGNYESALAARKQYEPELAARDARAFYEKRRVNAARTLDPDDPYENATKLAQAGDRENALAWLRKAKDQRDLSFVLAGVDPKLEPLHGDRGYVDLLRGVGLKPVTPPTR
jgi:DNA-binding winged helix-turn-helix (wHTH) protein/tetratricopeptide (TPR) repeat protein